MVGFKQSKHDECLFYKGKTIYLLYTDDSILAGPEEKELDKIVKQIADAGLDVTEAEGGLEDFLGVNIEQVDQGTYHLSQPQLIDQILKDLHLDGPDVAIKDTPALSTTVLSEHPHSQEHGALQLAKAPAMRPRTKHINIKYHHFQAAVASGDVTISPVSSEDQIADMLTKLNPVGDLTRHRQRVMGW